MSKFLKLVSENTPGAQNAYTVTLTDPDGGVVTQFKVTGTNFAFDNFQEFKAKMLGEEEGEIPAAVEDNQDEVDDELGDITKTIKTANAVTKDIKSKAGLLDVNGEKRVAKAKNALFVTLADKIYRAEAKLNQIGV
jgi:hypothetical protein